MQSPETNEDREMAAFIERVQVGNLQSKHRYDTLDELLEDVDNGKLNGVV